MSDKAAPFSMRLTRATDQLVAREARRTRRTKGAVVEGLAEEAMRCRRFPGIAFRGADWARRPWVIGTALDVWQIAQAVEDFGSIERTFADGDIPERAVRLTLAYAEAFPEQIADAVAENTSSLEDLGARFPGVGPVAAAS